jgi:hypothetical protein
MIILSLILLLGDHNDTYTLHKTIYVHCCFVRAVWLKARFTVRACACVALSSETQ